MLYYLPLEAYKARYTLQWSAPETGWLERRWREAGVEYTRIDGRNTERQEIKTGSVLDAVGRATFCFDQVRELLHLAEQGKLTSDDVIYLDDFWHPGLEALPYAFHLLGIKPKMFCFLHAQSVDEFDFTYPMREWMRPIERGFATFLTGIFVGNPVLKDLLVFGGVAPAEKVHCTGFPFASDEVRERMFPQGEPPWIYNRRDKVVFSSRWDPEKNPAFFLQVAETVLAQRPGTQFVVCTGNPKLKSSDPQLVALLQDAMRKHPGQILLKENLEKEDYYTELVTAKIQMNTADQDFTSITLLETAVAGCYPLYPYFRSFPPAFEYRPGFMYERLDVRHASSMIMELLDRDDLWTRSAIESRNWIYSRFDDSWKRMLEVMTHGKTETNPFRRAD